MRWVHRPVPCEEGWGGRGSAADNVGRYQASAYGGEDINPFTRHTIEALCLLSKGSPFSSIINLWYCTDKPQRDDAVWR